MYPSRCRRCGNPVTKPVDLAVWKLKLEQFQKDRQGERSARDRVGVTCLNSRCRHYEIFTLGEKLGEKPELSNEGTLELQEYDTVISAYNLSRV